MNWLQNFLTPPTVWGLAAAVPAVVAEYLYRVLDGPWHKYLWVWVPMQLAIGYCIYRLVKAPGATLIDSFVVWAFSTTALRVVATLALGDQVRPGTWFALCLIIMARIAQTCWGR